jgi:hypothetical protein
MRLGSHTFPSSEARRHTQGSPRQRIDCAGTGPGRPRGQSPGLGPFLLQCQKEVWKSCVWVSVCTCVCVCVCACVCVVTVCNGFLGFQVSGSRCLGTMLLKVYHYLQIILFSKYINGLDCRNNRKNNHVRK